MGRWDALRKKGNVHIPYKKPKRVVDPITKEYRKRTPEELSKLSYKDYLETKEWYDFRIARLNHSLRRCQLCNESEGELNIHHRTYKNIFNESFEDTTVLCKRCHELFHKNVKLCYDLEQ